MGTGEIIGTICGVAALIAALLGTIIPLVNKKYRKPLEKAQIGLLGIEEVVTSGLAEYRALKRTYDNARDNTNSPSAILQAMSADAAASLGSVAANVIALVNKVKDG